MPVLAAVILIIKVRYHPADEEYYSNKTCKT